MNNLAPKVKVLIVSTGIISVPCKYGAAIEMHTYNLANTLAELGCNVHYVTDITSEAKLNKNVKVHKVYSPRMKFPAGFPWWIFTHFVGGLLTFRSLLFTLIIERFSFDIVHVHDEVVGFLVSLFKRLIRLNVPLVFTLHNPIARVKLSRIPTDQRFRELIFLLTGEILIKKCDHVIALSSIIQEVITSRFRYPIEKVSILPHGISCDFFKPKISDSDEINARYGINGKYVLFVGRLDKRKGVDILLVAFSRLGATEYKCVIVGDGPERRILVKMVKDLGIGEKVIFTGAVPLEDLPSLYSRSEVFVSPTYAEAASMTVLEALASGLPVITTEVPGIRDVVINDYNGFVVNRNSEEFRACLELLTKNDSKRWRMKKNARLTAIRRHNWQWIARLTMKVYGKTVRGFRS